MTQVRIFGWKKGCNSITAIKEIREKGQIPLNEAHALLNRVLENEQVQINVPVRSNAIELVRYLGALGISAELIRDENGEQPPSETACTGEPANAE